MSDDTTVLLKDALAFLNSIEIESDEDSCMGMAFVTNRVGEDWYYMLKHKLEHAVERKGGKE